MTTLKDLLESVIGSYTPDYTATDLAQLDIPYICCFILLCIGVVVTIKSIRLVLGGINKWLNL